MHILSAQQFNAKQIDEIFKRADELKQEVFSREGAAKLASKYQDLQLATLFYQPSTRTRLSFETAALKLGVGVLSTENASISSSAAKGETLEDTIKIINQYGISIIVLRYNEVGGAKRAAEVSAASIINAGDGPGEHPTQALLDAYTIKEAFGRLNNLKIVMGGDLKYGRTVRSLSQLLTNYKGNEITFVSVPDLQISPDVKKFLKGNVSFKETDNMDQALKDADVVYWTRLQKENIKNSSKLTSNSFTITPKSLKLLPKNAIIMHPLPRIDEIKPAVDDDPRALYFHQAGNGLYIRMALIDKILEGSSGR